MRRIRPVAGDADRSPLVDHLEALDDRSQVIAKVLAVARHVVDRKHHNPVHSLLADPLRSDEPGRLAVELPGVVRFVQVGQAIAVGGPPGKEARERPCAGQGESRENPVSVDHLLRHQL